MFAPGIPNSRHVSKIPRVQKPVTWQLSLQRHTAQKAGVHYDLRLVEGQRAHSWALRHWPETQGDKRLAIQQPTHTADYALNFQGPIKSGYGAGDVEIVRREPVEILEADDDHLRFNLYPGPRVQEYLLARTHGSQWLLHNVTRARGQLPDSKPGYRNQAVSELNPNGPEIWQAKVDGAHTLLDLTGSRVRVVSYRRGRRNEVIDHTPKTGLVGLKTPPELKGSILRAELGFVDKGGRAVPAARVGGLLNSGAWKSRCEQEASGHKPVIYPIDVVRWQGKDVSEAPYRQKAELLARAQKHAPWLTPVPEARDQKAKQRLLDDIVAGRLPETGEGVVTWHPDQATPTKAKIRPEIDVYVRKIFNENQPNKNMGFPPDEITGLQARLKQGKSIFTTRIKNEYGKYNVGDIVMTPMGVLKVKSAQKITGPHQMELTKKQKQDLAGERQELIELVKPRETMAGGFEFSQTPNGPIIGRVGTGFGHGLKKHMAQDPELYQGLKARVRTQVAPSQYAPRAPVFAGWHLDQQIPEGVKHASWAGFKGGVAAGALTGAGYNWGLGGSPIEGAMKGALLGGTVGGFMPAATHVIHAGGQAVQVPSKLMGVARMAKGGTTPQERETAMKTLKSMADARGLRVEEILKHASLAFDVGALDSLRRLR